ncbi:MAG: VIT domain-containing protein [Planctomycetota bacterium]
MKRLQTRRPERDTTLGTNALRGGTRPFVPHVLMLTPLVVAAAGVWQAGCAAVRPRADARHAQADSRRAPDGPVAMQPTERRAAEPQAAEQRTATTQSVQDRNALRWRRAAAKAAALASQAQITQRSDSTRARQLFEGALATLDAARDYAEPAGSYVESRQTLADLGRILQTTEEETASRAPAGAPGGEGASSQPVRDTGRPLFLLSVEPGTGTLRVPSVGAQWQPFDSRNHDWAGKNVLPGARFVTQRAAGNAPGAFTIVPDDATRGYSFNQLGLQAAEVEAGVPSTEVLALRNADGGQVAAVLRDVFARISGDDVDGDGTWNIDDYLMSPAALEDARRADAAHSQPTEHRLMKHALEYQVLSRRKAIERARNLRLSQLLLTAQRLRDANRHEEAARVIAEAARLDPTVLRAAEGDLTKIIDLRNLSATEAEAIIRDLEKHSVEIREHGEWLWQVRQFAPEFDVRLATEWQGRPEGGPVVSQALLTPVAQVVVEGMPLGEVVELLGTLTQAPLVADWAALEAQGIGPETPITLNAVNQPLPAVLEQVFGQIAAKQSFALPDAAKQSFAVPVPEGAGEGAAKQSFAVRRGVRPFVVLTGDAIQISAEPAPAARETGREYAGDPVTGELDLARIAPDEELWIIQRPAEYDSDGRAAGQTGGARESTESGGAREPAEWAAAQLAAARGRRGAAPRASLPPGGLVAKDPRWATFVGPPGPGFDPANPPPVPLPLRHTEVSGQVTGFVATVRVEQQYENPFDRPIEAVYVFPLPHDAAVNEFIMTVGERRIRGIIREREQAEQIYAAAKAAGHTAALLTQERPNVFTQSVANIAPGHRIDVEIRYFNTLAYADGWYEFVFPMVVAPRFNPPGCADPIYPVGVEPGAASEVHGAEGEVAGGDAAKGGRPTGMSDGTGVGRPTGVSERPTGASERPTGASAATVRYLHPSLRAGHDIGLTLDIDAGVPIEALECTTHAVEVAKVDEERVRVALAAEERIANRDFVVRFRAAGERIKTGLMTSRDARGEFFALMIYPPVELAKLPRQAMEMIFVVDCSGSMSGPPLEQARAALLRALVALRAEDTFQVIRFSDTAAQLAPAPLAATDENIVAGLNFVRELASSGGTMMIEAVKAALDVPQDPARMRVIAFLTDGQIGNDDEILGAVAQRVSSGTTRIFSFGMGSAPNRNLMERLAQIGGGTAAYIALTDDAAAVMEAHIARQHPALTGVAIDWGGVAVSEVYPQELPDLIVGRPIIVTGRYAGAAPAVITVRGQAYAQAWEMPVEFRPADVAEGPRAVEQGSRAVARASGGGAESPMRFDLGTVADAVMAAYENGGAAYEDREAVDRNGVVAAGGDAAGGVDEVAAAEHAGIPLVWARAKIADLSNQMIRLAAAQAQAGAGGSAPARDPAGTNPHMDELITLIRQTALEFGLVSQYTAFVAVDSLSRVAEVGETVPVAVPIPMGQSYETSVGE